MKSHNLTQIINRIEKLEKAVFGSGKKEKISDEKREIKNIDDINFTLNERAFIKRYAVDKSGPKKFALLLAYLSKGETDKNIEISEIKRHWSKMSTKTLLGKFNMFYPNEAKTRGWVDSEEYGSYNLTKEWKNILV